MHTHTNNVVPSLSTEAEKKAFADSLDVLRYLRGPSGCSWDRKQTLESIRTHMLEESAELIEAIHGYEDAKIHKGLEEESRLVKETALQKNMSHLREEFGDVLLVWLMMMIIYEEEEPRALETTLIELKEKLIRRHPHVFSEKDAREKNDAELSKQWETIKTQQEGKPYRHVSFENFHPALDILERTKKFQKHKAKQAREESHKVEVLQVIEKIQATLSPLRDVTTNQNAEHNIAQLLYYVVELSRTHKVSPTAALMRHNSKVQ